ARSRIKELKGSPTRRWILQGLGGAVGLAAVSAGLIWTFQPRLPPGPPTPTETFQPRVAPGPPTPTEPPPPTDQPIRTPPGPPTPTETPRPTDQPIRTFTGHSGIVRSVAFSPDGRTALSASDDRTLKLWEVATGEELRTFTAHSWTVDSVAF